MKKTHHNFHVPLSEELYRALRTEADRLQQPATVVARHAIAFWLHHRQKAMLYESIRAYAEHHADTDTDWEPAFEAAAVEHWLATEQDEY